MIEAFKAGEPVAVWEAAKEITRFARSVTIEAARLRLKVNLGTDTCRTCRGLMAGPGVVATCYQRGQCYYTHFLEEPALLLEEFEARLRERRSARVDLGVSDVKEMNHEESSRRDPQELHGSLGPVEPRQQGSR